MTLLWKVVLFNFVLFFTGLHKVCAQSAVTPVTTRYISLKKTKKDESLSGRIHFSGIRLIDNRIDSSSINTCFTAEKIYKVNFKGGFPAVNSYVNENYRNDWTKDGDSLLVLVNDFRVSIADHPTTPFKAYFLLRMRLVFAQKNKDMLTVLGGEDKIHTLTGRDV